MELAIGFLIGQGRQQATNLELMTLAETIHEFLEKEYQGSAASPVPAYIPSDKANDDNPF